MVGSRLLLTTTLFLALLAVVCAGCISSNAQGLTSPADESKPEITLHGVVSGSQNHTYIEIPFRVPTGVHRVTVTFNYTGREQKTALDLGLEDPSELRCWSGGNKSTLTVGISDATPSCLPGLIPSGEWNILLGVPNIRAKSRSHYTAKVFLSYSGLVADEPPMLRVPLRSGAGWYRGDLHMHTGHSDGRCESQNGQMVPCPVFMTVEAAVKRGLDFIAITDHNATSQYDSMRELQPYFNDLLLIPGREITTFQGHMNVFGTTDFIDFRVGGKYVRDLNVLLKRVNQMGAIASINHPNAPGGEICFGCRWTPSVAVRMDNFAAVEAINGGTDDPAESGIPFWQKQLSLGHRLTAIGGSDNHQPTIVAGAENAVGHPTTVVYAQELSTRAILGGIRSGRVFVDVDGTHNRSLDLSAKTQASSAVMGGELAVTAGETIDIEARIDGCDGERAEIVEEGEPPSEAAEQIIHGGKTSLHWTAKANTGRGWFFVEVRDSSGGVLLLGNPIYVNWNSAAYTANHE